MGKTFTAKAMVNKNTKQISICIPKKKLKIFDNATPKNIKFEIKDIEW